MKRRKAINRVITFFISMVLVFQICFLSAPILHAEGEEDPTDNSAPTIEDFLFGNNEDEDFVVTAKDDLSGAESGVLYLISIETGDVISAPFSRTYYDALGLNVEYEDGKMHGKLPENAINAGVLAIYKIEISDLKGNSAEYFGKGNPNYDSLPEEEKLPEKVAIMTLEILKDISAPIIKSISLGKTELEGQDNTTISAVLSDNQSGVANCIIEFKYSGGNTSFTPDDSFLNTLTVYIENINNNDLNNISAQGVLKVGQEQSAGNYVINSVTLTDNVGNRKKYSANELPEEVKQCKFSIKNGSSKSPIVKIEMDDTELNAPCQATLKAELVDDHDGIGSSLLEDDVWIEFINIRTGNLKNVHSKKIEKRQGEDYKWDVYFDINISQNEEEGTYLVHRFQCGTGMVFYGKGFNGYEDINGTAKPNQNVAGFSYKVINENNNGDLEAPHIKTVSLGKTQLNGQDKTTISAVLSDNQSGVANCIIEFKYSGGNTSFTPDDSFLNTLTVYIENINNNDLNNISAQGVLKVGQEQSAGNYVINSVTLTDNVGNRKKYSANELPEEVKQCKFSIKNGSSKSPIVKIEMDDTELNAPCQATLKAELVDDHDGIGSSLLEDDVWIEFINIRTGNLKNVHSKKIEKRQGEDYKWDVYFDINISQNEEEGTYLVHRFQCGTGMVFYGKGFNGYEDINGTAKPKQSVAEFSFKVIKKATIKTSILDDKLIEKIKSLDNYGAINVSFSSGNTIAYKEIFSALNGTNKEIIFESNDISWQFNGSNIKSKLVKDVDLSVSTKKIEDEKKSTKTELEKLVNDKPTLVIKFPENGQLPGQATIGLKTNEDIKDYLGNKTVQVYYWDTDKNALEEIRKDVRIDFDDDIYFPIEHCSYYIITGIKYCKHKLTHVEAKAPTCTKSGNTEYWYCDKCKKYYSDKNAKKEIKEQSVILNATEHIWDCGVITKEADTEHEGEKTFSCTVCGAKKTETIPKEGDSVESFVRRFYKEVLNRTQEDIDNDVKGINDWVNRLTSGEKTGAQVAYGFVMSPEFANRQVSDEEYLNIMYKSFFNREPDENGYNDWLGKLKSGSTRLSVLAGFTNSGEFRALCEKYGIEPGKLEVNNNSQQPIQLQQPNQRPPLKLDASGVDDAKLDEYVERLYTEILGRPSDPEGKAYWKKVIIEGKDKNGNVYDAATAARRGFFESVEYKNKGRNDDEFLVDLYHGFFGREPDAGGYADWQNRMKNQGYSRQRVIDEGFGHSPEFKNLLTSYGFKILN